MRTVAVIGSFRQHFDKVREAAVVLRQQGWEVTTPVGEVLDSSRRFVRLSGDDEAHDDITVQSVALQRILAAEVVYAVVPGGYVGRTTCYEIGRVIQAARPLYLSERPDDLPIYVPDAHILPPQQLSRLQELSWLYSGASERDLEVVAAHARLTERIIQGRLADALSAVEDAALCDALGELWRQMTPEEQARADTRMMWTTAEVERGRRAAARFDEFFQDGCGGGEDDAV